MNKSNWFGYVFVGFLAFVYSIHLPGFATQTPDDEKAIRTVVQGYLNAKHWKDRLAFVHDAPKQEAAMREKYQGEEFQLQNPTIQKIEEIEKHPGKFLVKATWTAKPKGQKFAGYYVVGKNAEGIKIDWLASVGFNPINLKSLVAKKPREAHSLRLIATLDSMYLGDYANAKDTHYCFLLKEDNPLQTVYGYIPKDNPDGQRLRELLATRKETKDRVIVEIRFSAPDGQGVKNSRTVSISKLVSENWILEP